MIRTLAVKGYRSLLDVVVPLSNLNLVTGHNGSGKSNLYRALRLLAATAQGQVVASLAKEGGLDSTLWAGPEALSRAMRSGEHRVEGTRRKDALSLKLGFASDDFGYAIDLGLPSPSSSAFARDPEIKREYLWFGDKITRSTLLVRRSGAVVESKQQQGWSAVVADLGSFESMVSEVGDTSLAPELLIMRDRIRAWRFYDHFRSDADAPARKPQLGTRTPVLSSDGHDLAAAWQTIVEIGDEEMLALAVDDAFSGASVRTESHDGRLTLLFKQPGLLRELRSEELSDGTLRYLLWIAALHTPRPPELMVLNEPETSLHPSLVPALGRLIRSAAKRTQVWVVSHNAVLIDALLEDDACSHIELHKELGATEVVGQGLIDRPRWEWPKR